MCTNSFPEAPLDAITDNRVADLLGDGIADPRTRTVIAVQNLDEKKPPTPFVTAADG